VLATSTPSAARATSDRARIRAGRESAGVSELTHR
jgi:hypothetical protein